MRTFIPRGLLAAASAAAVIAGAGGPAYAQSPDTTAPTLNVATYGIVGPIQYGTGLAGTTWARGTGVGNWFVDPAQAVRLNFSATDDVGVTKLQYSVDNGVTWVDLPVTAGPSVTGSATFVQDGNITVRYRAIDAAGNVSIGVTPAPANTTLNVASAPGVTAIRLASTNGRAAGDKLTIDTGANQETATIASLVTPAPAAPAPQVNLTAPLANGHAAGVAVVAQGLTPQYRTIPVQIDTVAPNVTFPAVTANNNRAGHSATVTPTKADPAPSSGAPAARQAWIDGKEVTPQPLDVSKLSLGKHTYAILANDVAGNGTKATLSFIVTTSYADLDALVQRYTTPAATTLGAATTVGATDIRLANPRGRVKGDTIVLGTGDNAETAKIASVAVPLLATAINVTLTAPLTKAHPSGEPVAMTSAAAPAINASTGQSLREKVAAAKAADEAGDKVAAVNTLEGIAAQAAGISNATIANLLRGDALELARIARGLAATGADATGLGVTSERGQRTPQHPAIFNQTESPADTTTRRMLPSRGLTGYRPTARFKVLLTTNRLGEFRHESIQSYEWLIQQLGLEYNFDVDLVDYVYPNESIPNPLTSAANLAKYAVIVGNNYAGETQFVTARTCTAAAPCQGVPDGTVINEQQAFQEYMANGGGFVGLHGAADTMHTWPFYKELIGGEFEDHSSSIGAQGAQCPTCAVVEEVVEDPSHPSTKHLPKKFLLRDELYSFIGKCAPDYTTASTGQCATRSKVHPLITLNEASYAAGFEDGVAPGFADSLQAIDAPSGANANNEVPGYGADHPYTWCQNYGGGRMWADIMGHNWEPVYDENLRKHILGGIEFAAGAVKANCVTYREVKSLAATQLSGDALTSVNALLDSAYTRYLEKNYGAAMRDISTLKASAPTSLQPKVQELYAWMATLNGAVSVDTPVGSGPAGTVPATLSLTLGTPATFGAFTPGFPNDYLASTTANVISTAGDATLSVADPSSSYTGKLVNGAYALPQVLQARGNNGAYAPVGGSSAPTLLLTYNNPISNDMATVGFKQSIGASDPLRTGTYSKTLTFTLSTTTP
jgi:type 1 glutamine amidotransferase